MLVFAVVLLPLFVFLSLFDPSPQPPPILSVTASLPGRGLYLAAALAFLLPAAAAEEILFRGWVMRQALAWVRWPWLAILINGALFAAAHVNPNLDDSFQLAMMGVAFGYMSIRLGGIELATGAHAINNILLVLFFENLPFTPTGPHPFDPTSFWGGFVVPAACIAVTELAVRWPWLGRFLGMNGAPAEPAPVAA
jgi:membrane protease YdiL (CAAX protease family)